MSVQSFSRLNAASLHQSFMLGLNRSPLALPQEAAEAIRAGSPDRPPALAALALAGAHIRFSRPSPAQAAEPVPEAARCLHGDPRPVLPGKARRHLQRLFFKADIETSRVIAGAVLKRLNPLGLRLHPFDLPRLAAPLKSCGVLPGVAERAYLALTQTASEDDPQEHLLDEVITAESWRSFGKAARLRFLAELRAKDAAAGLALLQESFAQDPAALRSELVLALSAGLSAADQAFLEGLEKDRAESVRTVAAKLLSLLPGTATYNERFSRAAACLQVKPAKGLRRKTQIVFTRPTGASHQATGAETYVLFENIAVHDLAARLDMTVEGFLEALPDGEEALLGALLRTAVASRTDDIIAALVPRLSAGAIDMLLIHLPDSCVLPEVQMTLLGRFVARLDKGGYPRAHAFAALLGRLAAPLPFEMAQGLLVSSGWRDYLAALAEPEIDRRKIDPDSLMYTAMLLPAESMRSVLAAIDPLPPAINRKAHEFAHFVLALPAPAHSPACDER
jgi:hypothetical protein